MEFLSYVLLFLAVVAALWRTGPWLVGLPAAASAAAALASGTVESEALLSLGLGSALALAPALRPQSRVFALGALAGAGLFVLAAAFRLLPGFPGLVVLEPFGRTEQGMLVWRYDKGFAGLLLVWLHQRYRSHARFPRPTAAVAGRLVILMIGTNAILALAVGVGLGSLAPAPLPGWWLWVLGNTFLTGIPEESLFRGLMQGSLQRYLHGRGVPGHAISVGLSAGLFGLVHLPWGGQFAVLAALAGVIYGLLYGPERSLGWAIAGHAVVNASVLLLLASPFG